MAQTKEGALKIAAKKTGLSVDDYKRLVESGRKRCIDCKAWKPRSQFSTDASRYDELAARCRECNQARYKLSYAPVALRKSSRGVRGLARDGDKLQARRLVNHQMNAGERPKPNKLPCAACGHHWQKSERRHEYHHYLGYNAEHHSDVIVLCTTCHRRAHG